MKYIVTAFFSLCTITTVNASQLEYMKHAPATQYDIIKMDFKIVAYNLHQYLLDKMVGNTGFSYAGVDVYEDKSNIGLTFKYQSQSKNITQDSCALFLNVTSQFMTPIKLTETLWPNLTEKENLSKNIKIKTLLIPTDAPTKLEYCD